MTTKTKSPKVAARTTKSKPATPESAASARLRKEALAAVAANIARLDAAEGQHASGGAPVDQHNEQGGQQPAQPTPDERKQERPKPARKSGKSDKKSGPGPKPAKAPKPKRLSCIDAAAMVIGKEPIGCKDLIAEMGQRKLWTSPGGKTPDASLYAAIIREIAAKGTAARFKKIDRGLFIANSVKKGA